MRGSRWSSCCVLGESLRLFIRFFGSSAFSLPEEQSESRDMVLVHFHVGLSMGKVQAGK